MNRFDWETKATRRADDVRLRREYWSNKAKASKPATGPGLLELRAGITE